MQGQRSTLSQVLAAIVTGDNTAEPAGAWPPRSKRVETTSLALDGSELTATRSSCARPVATASSRPTYMTSSRR
jgi:hypothetical protein